MTFLLTRKATDSEIACDSRETWEMFPVYRSAPGINMACAPETYNQECVTLDPKCKRSSSGMYHLDLAERKTALWAQFQSCYRCSVCCFFCMQVEGNVGYKDATHFFRSIRQPFCSIRFRWDEQIAPDSSVMRKVRKVLYK